MRKITIIFINIFLCLLLNAQDTRILFVGNSYIYTNDLPNMLYELSKDNGKNLICKSFTTAGARFQSHWNNQQLINEIKTGNYDIMILQGQSQEVAFPYEQFINEVYPYAYKLDSLFKEYNPQKRIIYFMTWGYRYGDMMNCPFYPPFCSYASMSQELCKNYSMIAMDFQSEIAPIGNAWLYLYNKDSLSFDLHSSDYSHPNSKGTYYSACVLYTTIFNNVISSSYYANLSQQDAISLQQSANILFSNDLFTNCIYQSSLKNIQKNEITIDYNANLQTLELNLLQNHNNITIEIYNLNGNLIKQIKFANKKQIVCSLKDIPFGYYILNVSTDSGIYKQSFVKQ